MITKPNAVQKFAHRFLALKAVSAFLAVLLPRVDTWWLRLTGGRRTVTRFAGLPVIQLTTTGARSGRLRSIPLVSIPAGDNLILVASNFGNKHHPGWYYNLKTNPQCEVLSSGRPQKYLARELAGAEREKYFQLAVSYYSGYAAYTSRAGNRLIPVIILEPI